MQHLVDEAVLAGIPDALIRPLLAISIRASHPQTITGYQQLVKDIQRLARPCNAAGGESLYYIRVLTMVQQRMQAMQAAQRWVGSAQADATSITPDRWAVNVHSDGHNRTLLVHYEHAGVDTQRFEARIRLVVTEISTSENSE